MQRRVALGVCVVLIAAILGWLWLPEAERVVADQVPISRDEEAIPADATAHATPLQVDAETAREQVAAALPAVGSEPSERVMRLLVLREDDELPIAGARITAFGHNTPSVNETDADGRCALHVLPANQSIRLLVEKEGYFHVSAYYDRRAELTVHLASTVTLFGRVLAVDNGSPVPRARVALSHGWCKHCEPTVSNADDQGYYELVGVPRRRASTFLLGAEGYANQYRTMEIRSDEPRVELDFHLDRGVELSGRVVDFQSGAGISGAGINDGVGEIATDSSGAFREHLLLGDGGLDLRIAAKGVLSARGPPATRAARGAAGIPAASRRDRRGCREGSQRPADLRCRRGPRRGPSRSCACR